MPILSTKFMSSIFAKKRKQEDEITSQLSPDKLKSSFKDLFVRRNKAKVEDDKNMFTSSLAADSAPAAAQTQARTSIVVDSEVVDALQSVFDALHDPSLLDVRRHQRYDLLGPHIPPETPDPNTGQMNLPSLRCGRSAGVSDATTTTTTTTREISAEGRNAMELARTSAGAVVLSYTPGADIVASEPSADVDIIEIMRIPGPHCGRNGIEKTRNITLDIITDGIDNAALARSSTPSPRDTYSNANASMYLTEANVVPFSCCDPCSPPPFPSRPRTIYAADMRVIRFLGEGTTGKVYFVKDSVSKAKVALKVITKEDKTDYALSTIVQEFEISAKLSDSPWFVKLYASWHDHDHMYIAMTLYPTDLDSELMRLDKIEPERARFYMAELIIALTELHSRGIIHRDVKAPNILIDREGHIVLADFGLSKDFYQIPSIAERVYQPYWPYLSHDNPTCETKPRDPTELTFVAWDYRGSELEMAPEIHLRQPYSFGVDFWSAAIVLYWMLTGRPPWYEQEEVDEDEESSYENDLKPLIAKITEDDLPWVPSDAHVDEQARDFLEKMLAKDPKKRLLISYEMPSHPYFAGVNWPLLEARKLPAPWIPAYEVCHAYEQTSPTFVPGRQYSKDEEDPYPSFAYLSKQARRRIIYEDCDSSDDESDYGSDGPLTPLLNGEGQNPETCFAKEDVVNESSVNADLALFSAPISGQDASIPQPECSVQIDPLATATLAKHREEDQISQTQNGSASSFESFQEGSILKDAWDTTLITPPPTAPYSPGPKGWLHTQDLLKICHKQAATITSSATSASSVQVMYVKFQPSQDSALDVSLDGRSSGFTHLAPCDSSDSWPSPAGQHLTRVVNGTGLLFKVKAWWASKSWTPKHKRNLGTKRPSC
ncbi:kinase-like protein [Pholiota conissans]|uniref:non-specific serine/threonine protein kinase n=1 Tax=Pholiota conissans TaxID=109636 RepID=A0A9P6D0P1_9AGAR|nr:kinase-like protein [Pholiota conissans]